MICVSLARTRHEMVLAEHKSLAAKGAELVELRLDWMKKAPDLKRLLTDRPTPVVITCRRPADGGRYRGSEDERMIILRQAIVSGCEYVDLEGDIAAKVPRYGKTKRIVSFHDFKQTPDGLEEIHGYLSTLNPDIVKIVTMANSPRDNIRMLRLVDKMNRAGKPTVGFCMGEYGIVSRLLCGKFGSPFSYATFSSDRIVAPGQLSFDEMRKVYNYDNIKSDTKVFGVIGDPVAHSWSPLIHNKAFRHEKLNCVYLPMRIPAEELTNTLKDYNFLGVHGYSVTIPHKEAVCPLVNFRDEAVETCGAANTLYKNHRGQWFAANTDLEGALGAIREGYLSEDVNDTNLAGRRVLILGAGGAAKAIALGLTRAGAAVAITNRSKDRGRKLADALKCKFIGWENRASEFADILVNCTPVGMSPNFDETPFPQNWLRDEMLVFDTVYNPENTRLIKEARERGCKTVSGIEMFVRQAAAQFECFVNVPGPIDVMRAALRKGISPVRNSDDNETTSS